MFDPERTLSLARPDGPRHHPLGESAVFIAITVLAVVGGMVVGTWTAARQAQVQQVLTLLAVAGAIAAALAVAVAGRLDADVTALRLGSGLLVYGGVVLPLAAAGFTTSIGPPGQLLGLLALGSVALLLALGLQRGGDPTVAWPAAAVAVAASLACVAGTALVPALVPGTVALAVASTAVAVALGAVGTALLVTGVRRRNPLLRRVGPGVALLAIAHGGRGLAPLGVVAPWPTLTGLRPMAVAIILAGALPHLRSALLRQRDRDAEAAQRLRTAEEAGAAAERVASDRDHELRNIVLGLSGATSLLVGRADDERAELGAAVAAELSRLTRMLDHASAAPRESTGPVGVRAAIAPVVAVHRAGGARIRLDVPAGLLASTRAATLTQVVTNLLMNCARHAAGAPVDVSASTIGGDVLLIVRDHGPGLPRGRESAVFDRGRRSPLTGGHGLGLGLSRDLMRACGGDLRVHRPVGPGCMVVLQMPTAAPRAEADGPLREFAR